MLTTPGIFVKEQIYESANSLLYRGIRESDNQRLILKVLKQDYPTPAQLSRYRTEYHITQSLDLAGVVKVYDLRKYQNTLVMLLEDFGGKSLKHWLQKCRFPLAEFLKVAITTADALGHIHAANIIHKDINPSNIVFNKETNQLKIIDFGISTQLTRETPALKNPNVLEGTLAYMSPEQTGRMNRALDYRTDFYSLGMTFYELLTNQLPFETDDAMELVHCHIAKVPMSLSELNPEIPPILSEIVMKLLAKTAEERYQSAWGLKADLEECLNQLNLTGKIANFDLASEDISDKFQLPQKLYGREREIASLLTAFERVSLKQSELMLIAGYSGIGKSALVQELYKPITQKRGYFISGKFDQYQQNIPYSALVSAFQELIKHLLTESEAQLNQWREKLLKNLGINGQVIADVIPEIELIIGKQPSVPELGPNESLNRFNLVFQNFIKTFTQSAHPLVLFIDDLQWADGASLKLMQLLMSAGTPGLFLIGAYRDNEVSAAHPLMLTIDKIAKTGAIVNRISLSPLDLPTIIQLIADPLNCEAKRVKPLAELVRLKTGGNPFFMNEFLKSLYTEGLLEFDVQARQWQWNLEQIQSRGFTDNVVELMSDKIQKLSESTQEMLKLAACIGNQFSLKTLALIGTKSLRETVDNLYPAVAENLVVPISNMGEIDLFIDSTELTTESLATLPFHSLEYKFVHDRIQQAAYSLIAEQDKPITHRQIGEILLQKTPKSQQEEKIFDIVNQLNLGVKLIIHKTKREELAKLNLIAGKKAKLSAAYQPALNYLEMGIKLLATNSWQKQYTLTLALHEEAAEIYYLNSDFCLMEEFVELVLSQAKTVLDKVKVYEVKILAETAQSKFNEAINSGLEVLNLLKFRLPKQPKKVDVLRGLLQTKLRIGFKSIAGLVDLPVMTAPYPKAAMRILTRMAPPSFFAAPLLFPIIIFQQINLSINWGNTTDSAVAYSGYGLILCGVVGDIELGSQFGKLALNLLSRLDARAFQPMTECIVYTFIRHWVEPAKEVLNPLREVYALALQTGDLQYASYTAYIYCYFGFLSGSELVKLKSEMEIYAQIIRQIGQEKSINMQELYHQVVLNLLGEAKNPCNLIGKVFDEQVMLPRLQNRNDRDTTCILYFSKLMLCFLFGEVEQAVENAELAEQYLDGITALVTVPHFYFYDSLARLTLARNSQQPERNRQRQKVVSNQKKMKKWAHHAPANNLHKYYLVEAELCRLLGKDAVAMDYYSRAIAGAKKNEYIHEAAIGYELAAKFYLSREKELTARAYMEEARYSYQLWGATAKVKDLEVRYGKFFTATQGRSQNTKTNTKVTTTGSRYNLDIATMMKASQAISGEIVLDKLLSSLMKVLIENAGAQQGYLILEEQGELLIEAEGAIDSEQVTVLQSMPIENFQSASKAIINYVCRTQESVVLNNAAREGQFTNEPYIQKNQPKSVLCVPLINQGKLISIVYLENNLIAGAFTAERVEVIKLLSSQAAVSLENAKLYTKVRKNESRLAQLNFDLEQALEAELELSRAASRFVPNQFLSFLGYQKLTEAKLGDCVQLEMSILFSDIRDFTTISEGITPEQNFKFINSYLSRMEPAIVENNGFIDKYIGDAIMALFSGEADNAVKAGISMLHRLAEYNQHRTNSGYHPIQIGIGINTGTLMLGTVGGENRMDGTVISDAVNLASRVEGLTKNYGLPLLITQQTYERLTKPADYALRTIDTVNVKGKSQAITVYEIFEADPPALKAGKLNTLRLFTEALSLYNLKQFNKAAQLFEQCLRLNPGDKVVWIYRQRCYENHRDR
ncbi:AAA family ATPase [Microcoleus sp. FACHB-672]|uniref:AAA family ATPase n=1 Tax=Microcoleus sp. FACHB-672 TaxID=2692825 RepID=UPI001685DFF4|nr:AAA family ATPase [Microcoleus sp. FACHB-672]MBD2043870.1 AAA family ATPase [Microcoleus sp. FACHB-672]